MTALLRHRSVTEGHRTVLPPKEERAFAWVSLGRLDRAAVIGPLFLVLLVFAGAFLHGWCGSDAWPAQVDGVGRIRSGRLVLRSVRKRKFGSRVISNSKEIDMAKGQQKSNRETKKPKKEKIKVIAAAPSQKAAGWQPSFGDGKKK